MRALLVARVASPTDRRGSRRSSRSTRATLAVPCTGRSRGAVASGARRSIPRRRWQPADVSRSRCYRVDLPRGRTCSSRSARPTLKRVSRESVPQRWMQLATAAGIEPLWTDVVGHAGTRLRRIPSARCSRRWASGVARRRMRGTACVLARTARDRRRAARERAPGSAASLAAGERRFGLAAQLYALRRPGDQGIGDFTHARFGRRRDRACGRRAGRHQSAACVVSRRPRAREPVSPFGPTLPRSDLHRRDAGPDLERAQPACAAARTAFTALAARSDVDYTGVWQAKLAVLNACFAAFEARPRDDPLVIEFERFRRRGWRRAAAASPASRRSPLRIPACPGSTGPPVCGIRTMPEVRAFAARDPRAVRFASYLQWLADRQLEDAAGAARAAGLDFGLYRDLAVGAAPDSAETWSQPTGLRARCVDRRAPRSLRRGRAELGPAAADSACDDRRRLSRDSARSWPPTCVTPARCASIT